MLPRPTRSGDPTRVTPTDAGDRELEWEVMPVEAFTGLGGNALPFEMRPGRVMVALSLDSILMVGS